MQEEYTPEKIIEIINSAADASLEASLASKAEQKKARQGFSEKEISKILDSTSNEIVRREEVDYLATQIKNRFAKIKTAFHEVRTHWEEIVIFVAESPNVPDGVQKAVEVLDSIIDGIFPIKD